MNLNAMLDHVRSCHAAGEISDEALGDAVDGLRFLIGLVAPGRAADEDLSPEEELRFVNALEGTKALFDLELRRRRGPELGQA